MLFLARHGQTDWNAAGRWQGHTDVPINEYGRAQARALAERMRREGVAAVASSDLARARDTAEIVARMLGVAVARVDADLREQRFGLFEGLTRGECEARFPEELARCRVDARAAPPGGESRQALLARVGAAVRRVVDELASPALVVMHGGAMRSLLRELVGATAHGALAKWLREGIPNVGVVRVTVASSSVLEAVPIDVLADPVDRRAAS
jgi:probable phosphoglycerate mutase